MKSRSLIHAVFISAALAVWALAQQPRVLVPPAPGQSAVPAPPTVPGIPGNPAAGGATGKAPEFQPAPNNAAVVAPDRNAPCPIALQFPKMDGESLGFLYRRLTGRRVVPAAEALKLELYFVQSPPITYGEAVDLLKAACLMQGFVFVYGGEDWDKLVSSTQGPKPSAQGNIPLITSPLAIPEGDEVIAYAMQCKFIKPEEAARVFQSIITQPNAYGSIVPVPNASTLVITENASLIRSLIEMQQVIDVPLSGVKSEFIKVQYADVEQLATTLNELFSAQSQTSSTATSTRIGQPAQQPQFNNNTGGANPNAAMSAASGGATTADVPPPQIVPDSRTNRIFVMARPIDIAYIKSLINQFDTPTDNRNLLTRKLKFLAVGDFLDVAENALTRAFGSSSNGAAGGAGGAAPGRAQTSQSFGRSTSTGGGTGSMGRNSGMGNTGSSQFGGGNSFGGGGGTGSGSGNSLGDPEVDTKPDSRLIGRTLLVADKISNSIVVNGPPASVEVINDLLDKLDVKADQVMLSTVFGQMSVNDTLTYGIDWMRNLENVGTFVKKSGKRSIPGGSIAGSIGAGLPDIASDINNIANGGLGVYGTIGQHLGLYIQALQDTGKFTIISRPTIFTANQQKGYISSGKRIAVPSSSYNGGTTGQSTNIEYQDVALTLEVIPLINSEDEITLKISLTSDDVGDQRTIGTGANALTTNDIISRQLSTTVTVPNNQTVVLGGLIVTNDKDGIRGVPILSSIPGIGKLFSTTTKDKTQDELLIFIQPKIIRDERSMGEAQVDMDGRYQISPAMRRSADGPGVLPSVEPVAEKGASRSYYDTEGAPKAIPIKKGNKADPSGLR